MQCCQPLIWHRHRDQCCNQQSHNQPFPHILHHLHEGVVECPFNFAPEAYGLVSLMIAAVFVGVVVVLMFMGLMGLMMTTAMFLLTALVECFLPTFVHQPSSKQCCEQCGYRPNDGKWQAHE